MKKFLSTPILIITFILVLFLNACQSDPVIPEITTSTTPTQSEPSSTLETPNPTTTPTVTLPTPAPTDIPSLYDCNVSFEITSGPLAGQNSRFTVLGEDYFLDKSDKFNPGKKTAVYYNYQKLLILHSAYINGNLLKPLEVEFLRLYLERWGDLSNHEIDNNIRNLTGSEVSWFCEDQLLFRTTINHIIRLSHKASQQLWLEPRMIDKILAERSGLPEDWIGDMPPTDEPAINISFCGWGPEELGDERITYYRYVIRFSIEE